MMPDAIELVIVTPEKQLLRQKVADVQMPGENGYLGILPGHAPLMTELGIGELSYHESGGKEPAHIAIIRGFAEVLPDRVTILAETAERAEEIDLQRAKDSLAPAQKRLAANARFQRWRLVGAILLAVPLMRSSLLRNSRFP